MPPTPPPQQSHPSSAVIAANLLAFSALQQRTKRLLLQLAELQKDAHLLASASGLDLIREHAVALDCLMGGFSAGIKLAAAQAKGDAFHRIATIAKAAEQQAAHSPVEESAVDEIATEADEQPASDTASDDASMGA